MGRCVLHPVTQLSAFDLSLASSPALLSYARTSLRLIHFGGLILGFGGAAFLDLTLSRYRWTAVTAELVDNVEWISRFVARGLLMLWLSGIGFLLLYQAAEPEKVLNPKIWAKVIIVAILTINGIAIHRLVLPFLRRQVGKHLLADIEPRKRAALIGCGVVSVVSWVMPVVLGAAPQLNFVVPCAAILAAYAVVLVQGFLIAAIVVRKWPRNSRSDMARNEQATSRQGTGAQCSRSFADAGGWMNRSGSFWPGSFWDCPRPAGNSKNGAIEACER
jgi:hypothetical protein